LQSGAFQIVVSGLFLLLQVSMPMYDTEGSRKSGRCGASSLIMENTQKPDGDA
jgi:hypothetical protein